MPSARRVGAPRSGAPPAAPPKGKGAEATPRPGGGPGAAYGATAIAELVKTVSSATKAEEAAIVQEEVRCCSVCAAPPLPPRAHTEMHLKRSVRAMSGEPRVTNARG